MSGDRQGDQPGWACDWEFALLRVQQRCLDVTLLQLLAEVT